MRLFIDEKPCEANPGEHVLEVARANGIEIPSLCYHDALPNQACCRLCIVEVVDASERHSIVVSCTYPAAEGLRVLTQTEQLRSLRRMILGLLIEQAPGAQGHLKELCEEYEVPSQALRFNVSAEEKCILCGLCTRACEELGSFAIQTTMRGVDKLVAPPFNEPSETCIGCASCARVCPTGSIECLEEDQTRTIWGKTFTLIRCSSCGKLYATPEELEWIKAKLESVEFNEEYCPACRGHIVATTHDSRDSRGRFS